MKSLIITFCSILFSSFLIAQNNSGEVLYEDKRNIHKGLPPEMEAMKDRIPEFRTAKKILYFNGQEALYVNKPRDKKEEAKNQEFRGERGGRRGGRWGRNDNNKYYTNLQEKKSLDAREFFGKDFLIEGEREALKWKIAADQKQVGAYLCQKATYQDTTQSIVAWFTPMIPVSSGPDDFFGLPGLILHLDIDNGMRQITATNIDLKELEADAITRPEKGKKISKSDFDSMRQEKMKEMEEEYGGKGGGRWRMRGGRNR